VNHVTRPFVNDEYVIVLKGVAGPAVHAAFPDFTLSETDDATVLQGRVQDQAALYGLFQRIQDLGMEILEVRKASDGPV
jgi:hypothetical protein